MLPTLPIPPIHLPSIDELVIVAYLALTASAALVVLVGGLRSPKVS